MRVVLQKAKSARVIVNNKIIGAIDSGALILVGVTHNDKIKDVRYLAEKIVNLRIFEDDDGKMNLSLLDVGKSVLSVSQFTLYADTRKGRRPDYTEAAKPELAKEMYDELNELIRKKGVKVETGIFGKMMEIDFINDGPVTIIMDSQQQKE